MCRSYVVTRNSACLFYSIYCIAFYNFLFLIVISQFVLCLFTFVRCSYFTLSHNFSVRRLWCGVCYILLVPTSSCFLAHLVNVYCALVMGLEICLWAFPQAQCGCCPLQEASCLLGPCQSGLPQTTVICTRCENS